MKLTHQNIRSGVSKRSYLKGMDYYKNNPVLRYAIKERSQTQVLLTAQITEMLGQPNSLEIAISSGTTKYKINSTCSCQTQHCQHAIAIALVYCKAQELERKKHITNWLIKIKNPTPDDTTQPTLNPNKFIYTIFSKGDDIAIQTHNRVPININDFHIPCDNQDEQGLINTLKSQCDESGLIQIKLKGKIGASLISKMIATTKCYYKHNTEPLKPNPVPWCIHWSSLSEDYNKLNSNISLATHQILNTSPIMAINRKSNIITKLDENISYELLEKFINPPLVPNESIMDVYKYISLKYPHIPLNTPANYKTRIIDDTPIPALSVFQRTHNEKTYFIIGIGFKYAGTIYKHNPNTKSHITFNSDEKLEIIVDCDYEKQCIKQLHSTGINHSISKSNAIYSCPPDDAEQVLLGKWYDFLSTGTKDLTQKGFSIKTDESFALEFVKNTQIHIDSEKTDEGWFSLGFEIEIGDNKISLVPIVNQLISQYQDINAIPKNIYYKLEEFKYIRLDSQDILPIMETIAQLLNRRTKEGRFDVPPHELHLLGNFDESNAKWKGTNEIIELSKQLRSFNGIVEVSEPKGLVYPLRDYQKIGLNWLSFLNKYNFNGILADDMGLGKTLQLLAMLLRLKEQEKLNGPSIVVVPTSLVHNWKNEAKKFTPDLDVLVVYGIDRVKLFDKVPTTDLVITTYGNMINDYKKYASLTFKYIIVDEAHNIKNHKTKSYKSIMQLKAENKICISGTPIENNLGELWSLMNFLMPGFLSNENHFNSHYRNPIEKKADEIQQQKLNTRLKPFILRRTKDEVLNELPEKTIINKYINLDGKQAKLYESIRATTEIEVRSLIKANKKNNNFNILNALLQLRQVCCDPKLLKISNAKNVSSAKKEMFFELVTELLNENHKILVFSQFAQMLTELEKGIKKRKISYSILTGKSTKREDIINNFTHGDAQIFLISLKAGGVGLNLTQADTVIHYDHWWNPSKEAQASDRAHRMGQQKPVFVYKLIVDNSIESKIIEMQKRKLALSEAIYGDDKKALEKITTDDLLNLVN